MKGIFLLTLVLLTYRASGQRISNTAIYRNVSSNRYFRIHYENDYFSTTDIYYTQGINTEYVNPAIGNYFTSKLLVRSGSKEAKFGIALEHEGFTPTSISHPEILVGDRPFASCLFLKTFSTVNDSARRARISSSLSTGAIGPIAHGKEMQETIHRWINDDQPLGWENQIRNDLILNYELEYEHGLLASSDYFSLLGKVGARAGTLNTKAFTGVMLMAGLFDDPFTNFSKQKRKNQVYLYAEPLMNIVAYDATLQGGLFNKSGPYTISSNEITRLVFQGNIGIVFKIKALQLEYFQSYLTKEFKTGGTHLWGGIRIGWYLRK
jgi:lipid A 3-O-deacylase